METVDVRKLDLLNKLRSNRDAHKAQFDEAVEGYKVDCEVMLAQRLEQIKSGKKISMMFSMPEPVDMTAEYDKVIAMLEMSVDDVIELTKQEAQCYILNNWDWAGHVAHSNIRYTKAGRDVEWEVT